MKCVLFVLLGFAVGFIAVFGFADGKSASGDAMGTRNAASMQGIPEDARFRIATRLANARSEPRDLEKQGLLQRDIDQWMLTDPRGCMDWLHRQGALGLVRREHLRDVFASAFHGDLAVAIREALQIPNGRLRAEWMEVIFEEAQELDPAAAFDLLRHLPTHLRDSLGKSIVENLAKKDPAKAWTAIVNFRDSWHQDGLPELKSQLGWTGLVVPYWAEKNARGLKLFLGSKLDAPGNDRESVFIGQALWVLSEGGHPELVVDLLAGRERNANLEKLWLTASQSLATKDSEAAVRLIQDEPIPIRRKELATYVAFGLSAKDTDRALRVIYEHAGANQYDSIGIIIRNQVKKDPKAAAMNAMAVENVLARMEITKDITRAWFNKEPVALAEFALKSESSDRSFSWLDSLAEMHTSGIPVVQGEVWVNSLSADTRIRIGRAFRNRLTSEAWERISRSFEPAH